MAEGNPENQRTPGKAERDLIREALGQAEPRTDHPDAAADLPPQDTFPGYEIIREIHRGGQGAVYLAIQKATKRKVAVKVMHAGPFGGSAGRARFEREVQILGQLNHPNIVRIHDSGTTASGAFFYVMDYISGRSLDEHISSSRKPSIQDTLRLFAKICEGVNAAHLRGVIHRDLKPANVRVDSNGEPIVVDFGLAKVAVPDVTPEERPRLMSMTGQFIGSLPWASPEQAEGSPGNIDMRTDVYSLGVILYQMLTGRFPYQVVGNMRDVLDNILRAEPARPSTVRRQINDEVETIVLKCLSKERDRRYQSAGELSRDIQRYLNGEPIEAKRASGWYVIRTTLRRYKLAVGIALAFLIVVIGFGILMTVMYRQKSDAERAARDNLGAANAATAEATRQKAIAEENLASIRELARKYMFDFQADIEELRGTTAARELLLKDAPVYLERLRRQAGDDPGLLRDLADAYDRIGDIQGSLYTRKLGETAVADANYKEARKLREGLLAKLPDDPRSHADMARSLSRAAQILFQTGDHAGARDEHLRSLAEFDRALASPGLRADTLREYSEGRAKANSSIADALAGMAQKATDAAESERFIRESMFRLDEAESFWRDRLAADPSDTKAARNLGITMDRRTKNHLVMATALRLAGEKLSAAGQQADALKKLNDAIARADEARAIAEAASAEFESLSAQSPANAELRRDLFFTRHNAGLADMEAALALKARGDPPADIRQRHERALVSYQTALAITEGLAAADEASLEAQRDLVIGLNKVGNEYRELDRLEEAEQAFARSLRIRQDLFRTDPISRHESDLAVGYYKVGELNGILGDKATTDDQKKARYSAAVEHLQKSLEHFTALQRQKVLPPDSRQVAEVTRLAGEIRGKQAAVGR